MADQPTRLEAATVKAEIGSGIVYQFANDAAAAPDISTLSGDIPNLKKIILKIQTDGADKISFATNIFISTAAGIAATSNQEIFLVQASTADEIYEVWQNVSGVAVDTGKRSLSATAVIAATEAATEAAASAQESADAATIRVARFLDPSATAPTQRDDGQPLQLGDRYLNTTNQIEYIYKSNGWVANNLDAQDLSEPGGAERIGAMLPDGGAGTVQNAIDYLGIAMDQIEGLTLPGGAGFVNGAMQYAANYAAIRALPFSKIKAVTALGCLSAGDGGGGGIFRPDPTDTTSADNGGSILVTADGGRLKLIQSTPHRLSQFSAVCDGVANDSAAMQKLIDANKGRKVIIDRGTPMIAGVSLIGSSYNGTEIHCEGGELKLAPDAGGSTFGGAWIGLLFKDCSFNKANIRFDGNQTAMNRTREQIFCVASAGSKDFSSDCMTFRNLQGDGIYIAQSDWSGPSATTMRMSIGKVSGVNDTDSGRNTISVISVSGLTIGEVSSYRVGGLIGSVWQPGGIDIEPDQSYHTCEDISIGTINVTTAGTSGIGILGKAYTNDATEDWNIRRVTIGSFNLFLTRNGGSGLAATRVRDLTLDGQATFSDTARGTGITLGGITRLKGSLKTSGCTYGIRMGAGLTVRDFDLTISCANYSASGIRTGSLNRGTIRGHVGGSPSGVTSFGIECHNEGVAGAAQTNARYAVDAPYDNVAARAFRNDPANPVVYSGTTVIGCDWSGYSSPAVTCDALIFCDGAMGYTDQASMPANGSWVAGMYVRIRNPSPSAGKILLGWSRLTTGTGAVLNTDWAAVYATTA